MTKGYIYKITNKVNNKVYIGQTSRNIRERYHEHLRCSETSSSNQPLYNAMKKYGKEAFEVTLVEMCDANLLDDREIFYINQYDSYNNGYNATIGGEGRPTTDYEKLAESFIASDESLTVYAKENNIKDTTIRCALKLTGRLEEYKTRHPEYNARDNAVMVEMLDKETGKLVEVFESISKALKFLNKDKDKGHIKAVCTGKRQTAYGYKWQYA